MKKLFAILMTVILTLSLAACGSTPEEEAFETKKSTRSTKATKPTETTAMAQSSEEPTPAPTELPTQMPTVLPTEIPTEAPIEEVTTVPTVASTVAPTVAPTVKPTEKPTTATKPVHTHSYKSATTKAATCTADGIKTFTCSCGHSYTQKIAATGSHSWGAWTTVKEATVLAKGEQQRQCTACSATEKKELAMLTNYFYNDALAGRYTLNSISVVPVEVYFENGDLVLNCYIVNGFSTTATNVSILEMYVKDANGKTIAHDTFPEQNGTINAMSYVVHSFRFAASSVENTVVDMSTLTVNARFYCRH